MEAQEGGTVDVGKKGAQGQNGKKKKAEEEREVTKGRNASAKKKLRS